VKLLFFFFSFYKKEVKWSQNYLKWENHLQRLNTSLKPIAKKYREGKMKQYPAMGSEIVLEME